MDDAEATDSASPIAAWHPNEDALSSLLCLGISRNAAEKGLYYTGNVSADAAAEWVFEHINDPDVHQPLNIPAVSHAAVGEIAMPDLSHKMVFVIDASLGMGVGKAAAQVAHAAVGLYRHMISATGDGRLQSMLALWQEIGETKIVLKASGSVELISLEEKASSLNLPTYTVRDAGKTQIPAGSMTVLAIMGLVEEVDIVTGHLHLL